MIPIPILSIFKMTKKKKKKSLNDHKLCTSFDAGTIELN